MSNQSNTPLKLLIGGSPCTYWSIANKNRELIAEGIGWELFKNYLIAKEKFQPDYFLYENNKSAAKLIKEQISQELGVKLQYIDSSLVSAQHRERFYAHNILNVPQPKDRHIYLDSIVDEPFAQCVGSRGRINKRTGLRKQKLEIREGCKTNCLSTVQKDNLLIYPLNVTKNNKSNCITASYSKSGLWSLVGKTSYKKSGFAIKTEEEVNNKDILLVKNGEINYKDNIFPIKLPDGIYKIRNFTPIECERLQTLPDNYTEGICKTQRLKTLGNGWTAEVIIHILSYIDYPKDKPIEVLSLYDGIGTGRYCLDKLGYKNIIYKAYEIDKNAIQIATKNYNDIIECGDVFQIREDDWRY